MNTNKSANLNGISMARPSSAHFKKNQATYLKSNKTGGG
jgi:hypothetical protein